MLFYMHMYAFIFTGHMICGLILEFTILTPLLNPKSRFWLPFWQWVKYMRQWHVNSILCGFIWLCVMELFGCWYPWKLQYYLDNHASGSADNKDSGLETTKFFLNCLCLLLGRLDSKRFESTMSEIGMKISRILVPQVPLPKILRKYFEDIFVINAFHSHLVLLMNVIFCFNILLYFPIHFVQYLPSYCC